MKNIVTGVMSVIIAFMLIFIIAGFYGKTIRKQELENALNNGMQVAIEMIAEDSTYAPKSNEELIADLQQAIVMQINSQINELTINVVAADYKKGILKVEAIVTYPHLSGGEGSVAVTKTIILDYYQEELKKQELKLTFNTQGKLYRCYTVNYGDTIIIPPTPSYNGKNFVGWKIDDANQTIYTDMNALKEIVMETSMTFEAVFE